MLRFVVSLTRSRTLHQNNTVAISAPQPMGSSRVRCKDSHPGTKEQCDKEERSGRHRRWPCRQKIPKPCERRTHFISSVKFDLHLPESTGQAKRWITKEECSRRHRRQAGRQKFLKAVLREHAHRYSPCPQYRAQVMTL